MRNQKKGFTLVELIVVIAIIMILASVVFISLNRYQDFIVSAQKAADEQNVSVLNTATTFYARDLDVDIKDAFDGAGDDSDKQNILYTNHYISEIPVPMQENVAFAWDATEGKWYIAGGDAYLSEVESAILSSSMDLNAYLETRDSWGSFNSKKYKTDYWNGYLEYILEKGSGSTERLNAGDEGFGDNTLGLVNPVNGNTGVINYNNYQGLWHNSYAEYIPPAILITNDYDYTSETAQTFILDNLDKFAGTLIFNKANATSNEDVQIYYVKEDGTFSELLSVDELLGD